jgi:hypothetical protein
MPSTLSTLWFFKVLSNPPLLELSRLPREIWQIALYFLTKKEIKKTAVFTLAFCFPFGE